MLIVGAEEYYAYMGISHGICSRVRENENIFMEDFIEEIPKFKLYQECINMYVMGYELGKCILISSREDYEHARKTRKS